MTYSPENSPSTFDGRLTLTQGTAVTTSDLTAKSTIYLCRFGRGCYITVWKNGRLKRKYLPIAGSDISVAVPSTQFRLFDIWVRDDGTETPVLDTTDWNQGSASITNATNATPIVITSNGHGLSNGTRVGITGVGGNTTPNDKIWIIANVAANTFELVGSTGNGAYTSGGTWFSIPNTRGTNIAYDNNTGFVVKSGDAERRWVGTGMTGATSGQMEDSREHRYLYNYYNRVRRLNLKLLTTTHTYGTAVERFWNDDGQMKFDFIDGLPENVMDLGAGAQLLSSGGGTFGFLAARLNAYTGITTDQFMTWGGTFSVNIEGLLKPAIPTFGHNYVAACQYATGGTQTYSATGQLKGAIWQ